MLSELIADTPHLVALVRAGASQPSLSRAARSGVGCRLRATASRTATASDVISCGAARVWPANHSSPLSDAMMRRQYATARRSGAYRYNARRWRWIWLLPHACKTGARTPAVWRAPLAGAYRCRWPGASDPRRRGRAQTRSARQKRHARLTTPRHPCSPPSGTRRPASTAAGLRM